MILHVWTVLCSRSVIDIDSKNISIQNVIEQVEIAANPSPEGKIAIPMELVSFWARADPGIGIRGEARILFLQPSGKEAELLAYPLDLEDSPKARVRVNIAVVPVPEPGRYLFHVEYRLHEGESWQLVAKIPLDVNFRPEEDK
ncbi:MAG: hypothetical protein IPM39_14970 [Chloroflexi bacterium]|nr:hypothetical protein [Chloroflexota bacterium]